jgi:uncharacterized membrane protein
MSTWIVVTFDDAEEAGKVREEISMMQKESGLSLDDSAVVVKDAEGKIHVHNEMDRGTKIGAIGGGMLGLLITTLIFPIGGLILGALAGAGIGSLANLGIDKKFIKEVEAELQPNSSALFLVVRGDNPSTAITTLSQFKGKIYHTSLSDEDEKTLRKAMEGKF